jgi:hypothetical protein
VAVWAEQRDVLERVVETIAVDVMKGHRDRLSKPFLDPAAFAAVLLQPGLEQALLEVAPVRSAPSDQILLDWRSVRSRNE